MPSQGKGEVPDVGGVRMLDSRTFLLHYAHSKGGARPTEGCGLCTGLLEEDAGILTVPVRDGGVREGGRADESKATPSSPGVASWQEYLDFVGGVREQGEL